MFSILWFISKFTPPIEPTAIGEEEDEKDEGGGGKRKNRPVFYRRSQRRSYMNSDLSSLKNSAFPHHTRNDIFRVHIKPVPVQ